MTPTSQHFLNVGNGNYIQLVDNFDYTENMEPIIPSDQHVWIDINGNHYNVVPRNDMPSLFEIDRGVCIYYW